MMFKSEKKMRAALSVLAVVFGASAPVSSFAQSAAAPAPADAPAQAAGAPKLGWYKTCSKQEDNDICVVQNLILANGGQLVTAVGLISVSGKINRKLLQVSVPTARLIPPGIMMQIDGGKGQKLDYAVCLPDKCTAEIPLTDAMIASLKKGSDVIFTSINFRRAPNPIKISLEGFTGAYDGEPVSENKLAESQRSLQEGMQKKAEEARKKLEDAQKAAKAQ
ncbi:invasion associated locus B family protein [Rhizobium sophorae]|uniref:Invasion associated locus B family protein n=1 Tax=Rhizobium sophorae TaxID=1535242 RepID=A0A7Y3SB14_9HYPH|nr:MULTISPECIES: invasion associated locus B family protein [Rhizobium]MBX4865315.1 invasion associated locus B family protein [Rhizobium bangladeshense]NKK73743.1 invasion associated locus B family protein [Rhizobium leguminosarum bv. viciae]NKL38797.1 invasion associated locus B family protein [Rhizobium leguminosarum bv. viciae]NNU40404.1 invasion associated locus B family protein [Rhizobium sophorae]NNU47711.1 invasion associated locus B family protein [Rhizobium changzhiense]